MSALNVPPTLPSRKPLTRSGSAGSPRRSTADHDDDLAPLSRSRRNSDSDKVNPLVLTATPTAQCALIPRPADHSTAPTSSTVHAQKDHLLHPPDPALSTTTIYVGASHRQFSVHTMVLEDKSPFFRKLLAEESGHAGAGMLPEQTTFEDLDEFAMALFMLWVADGGKLHGPTDFHSTGHYLALYVLALKFEVEQLQNQVMDLVRGYYADQNMTAPAYRLEYIYKYTHSANPMRDFLISTAAFRAFEEAPHDSDTLPSASMLRKTFYTPGSQLSDSMRTSLSRNPTMAMDFIEAMIKCHHDGEKDARRGSNCAWHVHDETPECVEAAMEPWQSDGPADDKLAAPAAKPADKPKEDAKPVDKPKEDAKKDEPRKDEPKVDAPKKDSAQKDDIKPTAKPADPPAKTKPSPGPAGPSIPVPEPKKEEKAPPSKPTDPPKPPAGPSPPAAAVPAAKPADSVKPATPAGVPVAKPAPDPSHSTPATAKPADLPKPADHTKNDESPLKKWGAKMKDHVHGIKAKLHHHTDDKHVDKPDSKV